MTDPQQITRAIIERALSGLAAVGLTPEGAAALLAVQGIIRIDDPEQLASIALLARESAEALCTPESLH